MPHYFLSKSSRAGALTVQNLHRMWFAKTVLSISFCLRKLCHFIDVHTEVHDLVENRLPSVIFENIKGLRKKGEVDGDDDKFLLVEGGKSL